MGVLIIILVIAAIWTLIGVKMAERRGRDTAGWGLACFFLGLFAIIALAIAGETDEHRRKMIREEEEIRRQVQLGEGGREL